MKINSEISEKDENIAVKILEASLLSRQWKLTDITAAKDSDDPLTAYEKLHTILKAQRNLGEMPEGKVDYSCLKIAKDHRESVADVNSIPYSKFVTDSRTSLLEMNFEDTGNQRSGLIQSMLVIRWVAVDKAKQRSAIGQHCVWLECFTKAQSWETEILKPEIPSLQLEENNSKIDFLDVKKKTRTDNIVLFKLEHTNLIDHNFHQKKLCLIPITINIINCYGVPVNVFIDMTQQQSRDSFGELGWAGALHNGPDAEGEESKDLGVRVSIDRFSSRRLRMSALCAAPGSYLVGSGFTLTATVDSTTRPATLQISQRFHFSPEMSPRI